MVLQSIDWQGQSSLHIAVLACSSQLTALLLRNDADIYRRDRYRANPLESAGRQLARAANHAARLPGDSNAEALLWQARQVKAQLDLVHTFLSWQRRSPFATGAAGDSLAAAASTPSWIIWRRRVKSAITRPSVSSTSR